MADSSWFKVFEHFTSLHLRSGGKVQSLWTCQLQLTQTLQSLAYGPFSPSNYRSLFLLMIPPPPPSLVPKIVTRPAHRGNS